MPNIPVIPPAGVSPPPVAPKKTSPWIWVAGGCGVLILIVIIAVAVLFGMAKSTLKEFGAEAEKNPALAAAKLVVKMNPDLELVSSDDAAQTVTIKDKKSGQTVTLDLADIKAGKFRLSNEKGEQFSIEASASEEEGSGTFTMRSSEGEVTIQGGKEASVPDWVPKYPGSAPAGVYSSRTDEGESGAVTFQTGDAVDKVMNYFEQQLKGAGYEVTTSTFAQDGQTSGGMVGGTSSATGRGLQVSVITEEGQTQATVTYQETRPVSE